METKAERRAASLEPPNDEVQVVAVKGGSKGSISPAKVNGEAEVNVVEQQNGEKVEKENGLENGDSGHQPERRRSSRVKQTEKKEEGSPPVQKVVEEVKVEEEKKEELIEEEEEEEVEVEEEIEDEEKEYKILRRSCGPPIVAASTPTRAEPRYSDVERRTYMSSIKGRRSTRGANPTATPKRRAEEDFCEVGGKKQALDESSISWSFISTPFSKLGNFISSSTPSIRSRKPPPSDSMIVNYDEQTVRQLDDSDVDVETVDETSSFQPQPSTSASSSRWFCSLM